MNHYDFQIAGLLFRINSPFALMELFELSHFSCEYDASAQPDAEYTLSLLGADWRVQGDAILDTPQTAVYLYQDQIHRYFYWSLSSKDRFVLLTCRRNDPRHCTVYLQPEDLSYLLPRLRLAAFLSPERVLLENGAFLLHASLIRWQGQGILFSAPSGIGKSTQAELWHRLEGAEILNGDRAIIRYQDGQYVAYGSPYAGTSGLYVNASVPLRAIVVLSQSGENSLTPLPSVAAFRKLYQESTVCAWDPDFVSKITPLLSELVNEISMYSLACRPDEGAVAVLKAALTQ